MGDHCKRYVGAALLCRDTTGRVLVVPFGAELILPDERTYRNDWLGELPPTARRRTASTGGFDRTAGLGARHYDAEKRSSCRKRQVYVLGTAHEQPGAKELIENSARLYIGSSRDQEFIISDRSEKDLLSQLRWQVLAYGIGGLALAASV